jgi:hypothetical protein
MPDDETLVRALVHDAHVMLTSDAPDSVGREDDLDHVKRSIAMAERILSGNATAEDRASVGGLVHPQVRSTYHLS